MRKYNTKWIHVTYGTLGSVTVTINRYNWHRGIQTKKSMLKVCYGQHERHRLKRLIKALEVNQNKKDTLFREDGYSVFLQWEIL